MGKKRRNPIVGTAVAGRAGGGGGNPILGGGGGAPAPKKKAQGGGGIGGLLKETVGIVKSAPSGIAHMGKDLGVELVNRGKGMAQGLEDVAGGVAAGDPGRALGGAGSAFYNFPANPQKVLVDFGKGVVEGGSDPGHGSPLATGFGQSMRRTGERTVQTGLVASEALADLSTGHPGRAKARLGDLPYAKAYREGHLVGSVVEDVGNAAMVASAAAKGLSAASGGALEEAAASRATAKTLTEKVIPNMERELQATNEALAATEAQTAAGVSTQGTDAIRVGLGQARDQVVKRDNLTMNLDAVKAEAQAAAAKADTLLAGKSKALVQAHRMASALERMGNRGANAPFAPFELGAKGLGKSAKFIVEKVPGLSERLAPYSELAAVKRLTSLQRKSLSTIVEERTAESEALLHRFYSELEKENALLGGDHDLWHATAVDLTGANRLLLDPIRVLERMEPGARARAIEELAAMPGFDGSPAALEKALAIAEYRDLMSQRDELLNAEMDTSFVDQKLADLAQRTGVDARLMAVVDQVQAGLRANILDVLQGRYLEGRGTSAPLTEEALGQRRERSTSSEPNPVEMDRLAREHEAQMAGAEQARVDAAKRVAETQKRITLDPEAVANLSAATARDATIAGNRAAEMIRAAADDAQVLDDVLAATGHTRDTLVADEVIPAHIGPDGAEVPAEARLIDGSTVEVDPDTPIVMSDDLHKELSDRIMEAGGRINLQRKHPVLGRAVRDSGMSGIRHQFKNPEVLTRWQRQIEYRAKAQAERAMAERLASKAERLRQQNPALVKRVVKAVDRVFRARARAGEAAEAAARVREQMLRDAGVQNPADLPDWMLTREQYGERARAQQPAVPPRTFYRGESGAGPMTPFRSGDRWENRYFVASDRATAERYAANDVRPGLTRVYDVPLRGDARVLEFRSPDGKAVNPDLLRLEEQARRNVEAGAQAGKGGGPFGTWSVQNEMVDLAAAEGWDAIDFGGDTGTVVINQDALISPTQQSMIVDAQDWSHAQAVADAMEQGQPVPPWVVEDYKKVKEPRRPENSQVPKRTHWDPFTGEPKTKEARNYLRRKAEVDRLNAERAANPYRERILAGQTRATAAWKRSGAGREYAALEEQVVNARKGVVAQARAELVGDAAFAALPDTVPFMPGRVSEYYDAIQQSLGAPDWSIAEEMNRLRQTSRWANASDEEVFAAAYGSAYRRLPAVAKESLKTLKPQEVRALYAQWRRGGVSPDVLGLDAIVDEWAASMNRGRGVAEREANVAAFSDAIERRARLRRIESSGASGGFLPDDLVEFFRTTLDDEMRGIADDPVMATMLGRGAAKKAARDLFEGRLRQSAERIAAMVPDAGELSRRLEGEPFPFEPDQVHGIITDLQGIDAADDFMGAWYAAGEPSLDDALTMLEQGDTPAWLLPAARDARAAVERAGRRAAASLRLDDANAEFLNRGDQTPGLDKLTPEERVLRTEQVAQRRLRGPERDLERTVAQGGSRTVADLAAAQGERAARAEARVPVTDPTELRTQTAARLTQTMAGQLQRHGAEMAEHLRAVRDLQTANRRIEKWLPERFDREIARAEADLRNAPVRYRRPLTVARGAQQVFKEWIGELEAIRDAGGKVDESVINALRQAHMEVVTTLRDATHPGFSIGADGQPVELPPLIDPTYVPGGRVGPGSTRGGGEPRLGKSASERVARGGNVAPSPEDFRQVLTQRVRVEVRNDTARQIEAHFGVRPGQVLGAQRMQDLADEFTGNKRRANQAMLDEMAAQGYVPWNPRKMQPSSPHLKGYGTFVVDTAEALNGAVTVGGDGTTALTTSTLWIPKGVADSFERHFKAPGTWEMRARKYWDKPTNVWKTSVLPFAPRWHVNNIVGNFIMATAGAGVSPTAWARSMMDAYAILKRDDLAFRAENGLAAETRLGRGIDRLRGGAETRLERADARIARIPEATRESVLGPEGMHLDPRIPQRGAGSAALDPYTESIVDRGRIRGAVHNAAQRSYEFNGFMDDLNRVAVYLEKHKTMSDRELAQFAAQHPSLAVLGTDKVAMRKEAAVRLSLDALGNFRKMSPFERQIVRRAVPFYAWLRHITLLAGRLPITSPVRVAWMLHLADMYGEPPEFDLLANTFPLGGNTFLRMPRANPFEDVLVAPSSGNPGQIVTTATGSLGPIPRLAAAAAGFDTRTAQPLERPAGSANADQYGRDQITPTLAPGRLGEFLNVASRSTPLTSLALDQIDALKNGKGSLPKRLIYGQPVLRYPTGQPYLTGAGTTIPSGRPAWTGYAGLSGLPVPFTVDVPRLRQAKAEREQARARAQARRRRRPAAATSGSNPILG